MLYQSPEWGKNSIAKFRFYCSDEELLEPMAVLSNKYRESQGLDSTGYSSQGIDSDDSGFGTVQRGSTLSMVSKSWPQSLSTCLATKSKINLTRFCWTLSGSPLEFIFTSQQNEILQQNCSSGCSSRRPLDLRTDACQLGRGFVTRETTNRTRR